MRAETNPASSLPEPDRKRAPQGIVAAVVRQDTVQLLEKWASSGRPLAEVLEDTKRLLTTGAPHPDVMVGRERNAMKRRG